MTCLRTRFIVLAVGAFGILLAPTLAHGQATPAGSLDPAFGVGGLATSGPSLAGPNDLAVAPNGDIYVVAAATTLSTRPGAGALLRTSAGGVNGLQRIATVPNAILGDVVVQPDGKVIASGWTRAAALSDPTKMLVARFNPDGTPDATFSGDGVFTSPDATAANTSVTLAPDGKVVVAGTDLSASPDELVMKRLNPDGSEDATYVASPGGASAFLSDVVVQADGKAVAVGGTGDPDRDWLVVRLGASFTPDPSFSPPAINFGSNSDLARGVAVQPDGRILVGGSTQPNNGPAPIIRLLPDGGFDPTWGVGGTILIRTGPSQGPIPGGYVDEVGVDTKGRVLAEGNLASATLLQRFGPDGTPDQAFAFSAPIPQTPVHVLTGLVTLPDDKALISFRNSGRSDPPPLPGESTYTVGVARVLGEPMVAGGAVPAEPVVSCGGKSATITGTSGRDVIKGTRNADVVAALGGPDLVKGLHGNDLICGGPGRDRLVGGAGRDLLYGESGKDRLIGGKGRDRLRGGKGKDSQRQ